MCPARGANGCALDADPTGWLHARRGIIGRMVNYRIWASLVLMVSCARVAATPVLTQETAEDPAVGGIGGSAAVAADDERPSGYGAASGFRPMSCAPLDGKSHSYSDSLQELAESRHERETAPDDQRYPGSERVGTCSDGKRFLSLSRGGISSWRRYYRGETMVGEKRFGDVSGSCAGDVECDVVTDGPAAATSRRGEPPVAAKRAPADDFGIGD